ncbi:MAG: hypothetical protein ACXVCI_03490 [Bdellovibrionota bacterium]
MLIFGFTLWALSPSLAIAGEHGQYSDEPAISPAGEKTKGAPVVAMNAKTGKGLTAGEMFTAGADPTVYVNRHNQRFEVSPRSVTEFDEQGIMRLLRGSAVAESAAETSIRTAGATVEFVGKVLVSYDHSEHSTSAFVLSGESRLVNSHRSDSSLRLQRFHGATLVVGEVLPQLIRALDVGSVQAWLKGYSWPTARRVELLKEMPGTAVAAKEETPPKHLQETKIEDYFSSIDTADEFHQPDYYEKKFDDPDKVVAEQNSKQGAAKTLSPEEAALISLPKTQIDLGFDLGPEFLTADQKSKEVARPEPPSRNTRAPASVKKAVKAHKKAAVLAEQGDPEVNQVLERLRQVRNGNSAVSQAPSRTRAPSSVEQSPVPDPVYDYSQNF